MVSVKKEEKLSFTINASELTLETSNAIFEAMSNATGSEDKIIQIDFRAVRFIDSSGISMLVKFIQCFGTTDRRITLINVSLEIKRIMNMVNLSHFFHIL